MLKLKKKNKKNGSGKDNKQSAPTNLLGIAATGNALNRIASLAMLAVLIPVALGFGYLILQREPAMQKAQIERVANSFAVQQATNIHHLFTRLKNRVENAALSPLALQAIANQQINDIELVEEAMLDYFPEVVSLRIIPISEMGTADFEGGNQGLRNHIEVDMVGRTSESKEVKPESYQFEGAWLTSFTALISHPRLADRQAVIIGTLDNKQITEHLKSLDSSAGRFALEQRYTNASGKESTNAVAFAGNGNATAYTGYADVPGTLWRVAFTPSQALINTLTINRLPLLGVLGLCALAALASLLIIVTRFPKALDAEVKKVISSADRKTPLELSVPELVTIAKQLRRATLRSLRQGSNPVPAEPATMDVRELTPGAADLTNPMFQSDSILDEDDEVLELDLTAEMDSAGPGAEEEGFPSHIFRAYDIRGNADTELNDDLMIRIGRAIGTIAGDMDEQTLIVGCDGRTSSPRIKSALIRSLMETGRDVIDIGLVPTPLLYFATRHLSCKSGIMITGSHNPADHNGLKIVLNQQTIAAGGIQDIRTRVLSNEYDKGNGRMIREEIIPAYMDEVLSDIAIAVPLKIVLDAGNGATSEIAPELFEELGCEIVPLHCQVDGTFPNHPPDTSNEDNLTDLVEAVQREGADFGVAFDGDGDRLAIVTSSGRILRSDVLLMIYAQDVVSRNPGADVVFDVKCSRNLTQLIANNGGRPVLWKTGHAFMKEKMVETGALLGGEFSGHMFFGERWYGFDDGMYAAGRLAEILSTHGKPLDELVEVFPQSVNTPEILIPVPESKKFGLMDRIVANADFSAGKVNTLDGIRVDFSNGWGLLRASNTSACLTARFEADTQEILDDIMAEFKAQIALVDSTVEINF